MSQTLLEPKGAEGSNQGSWMVVIFNNDTNSVEEVVDVLRKATGCSQEEAEIETWEAHTFGKASVHFGNQAVCSEAAEVIGSIGVKVSVEPEWEA
jgi:ATP-dependent Clp protease adaptor protein ClpS